MTTSQVPDVTAFVDPQCPFAWITTQWLLEVGRQSDVGVRIELMSLSAVNEGRELDDWYRDYNDEAWGTARVAAALLASPRADSWPRFYAAYGQRRHVEGLRDNPSNVEQTLAELQLPASLAAAADDPGWDDELRARTRSAVEPSGGDGGTPMVHVGGRAFFGPVLTSIPRGEKAVQLWAALDTLAGTAAFAEIRGARSEDLQTS